MTADTSRQIEREAAQRQAALGRRVEAIQAGQLGSVLKRWINADVVPIAALLREVAEAYLASDMARVSALLDSPTAELSERERPLRPLMEWCLRGKSPGRGSEGAGGTYADDIVLAFMATTITRVAQDKCSLSAALAVSSDAIRQTVQGQFITGIQGAQAMQAIRERRPEVWAQKKSLARICALLTSQVKPQVLALEEGIEAGSIKMRGHKAVLKVQNAKGEERMLTVVPPDAVAWEVMSLCWQDEKDGGTSPNRSLWLGFAGVILAAAQRVGGWFEVAGERVGRKGHTRTTKYLVLSQEAHRAITADTERWLQAGFTPEPMVVPPEGGDYLTVKHRPITGQRPPRGLLTQAKGTTPWIFGAGALADTPWTVNRYALGVEVSAEDSASIMRIAAHRRLAMEEALYLPTTMDFRGRIYYRTPWVSPQSGDLGKSLLCFPPNGYRSLEPAPRVNPHVAMHMAGLYGGPDKLDKAPLGKRMEWWESGLWLDEAADKPLTFAAHFALIQAGEADRIPIQLDGTCNGLQHLSALFRDEEGARHVNLCASTLEDSPADIYGVVAGIVSSVFEGRAAWGNQDEPPHAWAVRMESAGLAINRKLCKGPVMVLPYGGTREAVRLSVKAAVLDQIGDRQYGADSGKGVASTASQTPWHNMTEDNYDVFKGRDLFDHPGFNTDVGSLSGLVWDSIAPAIPKAMAAMGALTAIGGFVGDRGLSWRVGLGDVDSRLWVTQAKSMSSRKQVTMRGFHLPDMVRRLTLMANTNAIDPKGHRTGIVANFIHSQDAAHLAHAVATFRARGGGCVGSVHDCLLVRPSEASLMGICLRDTFVELYEEDPLSQPVRLLALDPADNVEYASWYELAEAAGVAFPERGSFDIQEVRKSAWFFS